MINRIDFIHRRNYYDEVNGDMLESERHTYLNIFEDKLSASKIDDVNGYFIQAPATLSFSLIYDEWINSNIIDPANDSIGRYQTAGNNNKDQFDTAAWTTGAEGLVGYVDSNGVDPSHFYGHNDYRYYTQEPVEYCDYYVIGYDKNGTKCFFGVIESAETSKDGDTDIVSFSCQDMMVLISKSSEKNSVVLSNSVAFDVVVLCKYLIQKSCYYYLPRLAPQDLERYYYYPSIDEIKTIPIVWNATPLQDNFVDQQLIISEFPETFTNTFSEYNGNGYASYYWCAAANGMTTYFRNKTGLILSTINFNVFLVSLSMEIIRSLDNSIILRKVHLSYVRFVKGTIIENEYKVYNSVSKPLNYTSGVDTSDIMYDDEGLVIYWTAEGNVVYDFLNEKIDGLPQYSLPQDVNNDFTMRLLDEPDLFKTTITNNNATYTMQSDLRVLYSNNNRHYEVKPFSCLINGGMQYSNLTIKHQIKSVNDILKFIFTVNNYCMRIDELGRFVIDNRNTEGYEQIDHTITQNSIINPKIKRINIEKPDIDFTMLIDPSDSTKTYNADIVEIAWQSYYQKLNDRAKYLMQCKISTLLYPYPVKLAQTIFMFDDTFRISSISINGSFYDIEAYRIFIAKTINLTITDPFVCNLASTQTITWECNTEALSFTVKLSVIKGEEEIIIATGLTNSLSGTYSWLVPSISKEQGIDNKLRVTLESDPEIYDEVNLSVLSGGDVITKTLALDIDGDPAVWELASGSEVDIDWISSANAETTKLRITMVAGNTTILIADNVNNGPTGGTYAWTVPTYITDPGTQTILRIAFIGALTVKDEVTIVIRTGTITVNVPDSDSILHIGNEEELNIEWTTAGSFTPQSLMDIRVKNDYENYPIVAVDILAAESIPNTGSYSYKFKHEDLYVGGNWYVQVKEHTESAYAVYGNSANFSLLGPDKWVLITDYLITYNDQNGVYPINSDMIIKFNYEGIDDYKFSLYLTDGTTELVTIVEDYIDTSHDGICNYTWTIPAITVGEYYVKIKSSYVNGDDETVYVTDQTTYKIEIISGSINLTTPADDEGKIYDRASALNLTWTTTSGTTPVNVKLFTINNDGTGSATNQALNETNDGAYVFTAGTITTNKLFKTLVESTVNSSSDFDANLTWLQFREFESVTTTITVNNLNTGVLANDSILNITWTSASFTGGNIDVVLMCFDSGNTPYYAETIIGTIDPDLLEYGWIVENILDSEKNYRILFRYAGQSKIISQSNNFKIKDLSGFISIEDISTSINLGTEIIITINSNRDLTIIPVDIDIIQGLTVIQSLANRILLPFNNYYEYSFIANNLPANVNPNEYKVRVSRHDTEILSGATNGFYVSSASTGITVLLPTGTSVTTQPFSNDITWWSSGLTDDIKIELFKGGVYLSDISTVLNNGKYVWRPTGLTADTDYSIKVFNPPLAPTYDDETAQFEILSESYWNISPGNSGSQSITKGSSNTITWQTGLLASTSVQILLKNIRTGNSSEIVHSTLNTGTYTWPVRELSTENHTGEEYTIVIISTTDSSLKAESLYNFTLTNWTSEPILGISIPSAETTWHKGNTYSVQWGYNGAAGPIQIEYKEYDMESGTGTILKEDNENVGISSVSIPSDFSSSYSTLKTEINLYFKYFPEISSSQHQQHSTHTKIEA